MPKELTAPAPASASEELRGQGREQEVNDTTAAEPFAVVATGTASRTHASEAEWARVLEGRRALGVAAAPHARSRFERREFARDERADACACGASVQAFRSARAMSACARRQRQPLPESSWQVLEREPSADDVQNIQDEAREIGVSSSGEARALRRRESDEATVLKPLSEAVAAGDNICYVVPAAKLDPQRGSQSDAASSQPSEASGAPKPPAGEARRGSSVPRRS